MSVVSLINARYPRSAGPATPVGTYGAGVTPLDTNPSVPTSTATALPPATPDVVTTVADAYLAALGSQPANPGATVVVPTPPIDNSGGGMNIKTIAIVVGIALVAFIAWKKYGKGATGGA